MREKEEKQQSSCRAGQGRAGGDSPRSRALALGFGTQHWCHSPAGTQGQPLHRGGHTEGFAGQDTAASSPRNGDEPQQHRAATAVPVPSNVPSVPRLGHRALRGRFPCPVPSSVLWVTPSSSSSSLLLSRRAVQEPNTPRAQVELSSRRKHSAGSGDDSMLPHPCKGWGSTAGTWVMPGSSSTSRGRTGSTCP